MFQLLVWRSPSWGRITLVLQKCAESLWGRIALWTPWTMTGWETKNWGRFMVTKKTISDPKDLPRGSVTWQGPSSCCCTALQPLRGSRAQLSSGHHSDSHRQGAKLRHDSHHRATLGRGFQTPNQCRPLFQKQDSWYDGILNNGCRNFRSSCEGFQC